MTYYYRINLQFQAVCPVFHDNRSILCPLYPHGIWFHNRNIPGVKTIISNMVRLVYHSPDEGNTAKVLWYGMQQWLHHCIDQRYAIHASMVTQWYDIGPVGKSFEKVAACSGKNTSPSLCFYPVLIFLIASLPREY